MQIFFFAVCPTIHTQVFRVAEIECPRIFGKHKSDKRPDKPRARLSKLHSDLEEIWNEKLNFVKNINKLNERVSQFSNRNADENMNKTWGDWLVTCQVVHEMQDEKKKTMPSDRFKSKK